jgi:hypothetical protein
VLLFFEHDLSTNCFEGLSMMVAEVFNNNIRVFMLKFCCKNSIR